MSKPWFKFVVFPALLLLFACGGGASSPKSNSPAATPSGQSQSQITVSLVGSGNGTITSNPPGISCGQTCTGTFSNGSTVTLTASPATDGSVFSGWSGACSGSSSCALSVSGTLTAAATFSATLSSIHHIVYMLQENRSFDNYFGHLNAYRQQNSLTADIDGTPADASNPAANGSGAIAVFHMKSVCTAGTTVNWYPSHIDRNRFDPNSSAAKMNGFVAEAAGFSASASDPGGIRAMGYYDETDLPYYYFMATQFATSDRWFSPVMSRTIPNRLYAFAATSAGWTFQPPGNLTNKTIFQLLDAHNLSWKIYLMGSYTYLDWFQPYESQHAGNIVPISEYYADAQNGTLPELAFIETDPTDDEHPENNIQIGAAVAAKIVNAFLNSPSWKDSVFILTYDEGGGLYDHVPPFSTVSPDGIKPMDAAQYPWDFNYTGFRVPLIVISPFTRPHYVSHTVADYTAILKFIETRFGLPSLTRRDAAQMDMTEFFDFVKEPWRVPPVPPAQPTDGVCNPYQLQ